MSGKPWSKAMKIWFDVEYDACSRVGGVGVIWRKRKKAHTEFKGFANARHFGDTGPDTHHSWGLLCAMKFAKGKGGKYLLHSRHKDILAGWDAVVQAFEDPYMYNIPSIIKENMNIWYRIYKLKTKDGYEKYRLVHERNRDEIIMAKEDAIDAIINYTGKEQKMNKLVFFTDGGYSSQKKVGSWAYVVQNEGYRVVSGHEFNTTNNVMEMKAVLFALRYANTMNQNAIINSDSQYVVKGLTEWVHGWVANGWKTTSKKDVLNKELWEELYHEYYVAPAQEQSCNQLQKFNSPHQLRWVKGHAGIIGNTIADNACTKEIEAVDDNVKQFNDLFE